MSNNKYDATFFDPKPEGARLIHETVVEYHGEAVRKQRGRHVARAKQQPLFARILAGLIVGGFLLWGVVSCGASMAEGARFAECMADARAAGGTVDEFTERDCREQAR